MSITKFFRVSVFSSILAASAFSATVWAQGLTIEPRAMLISAEGQKIAPIDRVVKDKDGAVVAVKLIYNNKLLTVPADTLSVSDDGVKTSLTKAQLRKM